MCVRMSQYLPMGRTAFPFPSNSQHFLSFKNQFRIIPPSKKLQITTPISVPTSRGPYSKNSKMWTFATPRSIGYLCSLKFMKLHNLVHQWESWHVQKDRGIQTWACLIPSWSSVPCIPVLLCAQYIVVSTKILWHPVCAKYEAAFIKISLRISGLSLVKLTIHCGS